MKRYIGGELGINIFKIKLIIGDITINTGDLPPKIGNMSIIKIIFPYFRRKRSASAA